MESQLEMRAVRKSFLSSDGREIPSLGPFSLSLGRGEIVALLGPNGCGKSTILKILTGKEKESSGSIRWGFRHQLSYLQQGERLLPWRSLLENLKLPLSMQGQSCSKSILLNELIEEFSLRAHLDKMPTALSGGLKQRALLVRSLLIDADVLLLDEPFAEMDINSRERYGRHFRRRLKERGICALFVTHSFEEAGAIADRSIIFSEAPGQILREIHSDHNEGKYANRA